MFAHVSGLTAQLYDGEEGYSLAWFDTDGRLLHRGRAHRDGRLSFDGNGAFYSLSASSRFGCENEPLDGQVRLVRVDTRGCRASAPLSATPLASTDGVVGMAISSRFVYVATLDPDRASWKRRLRGLDAEADVSLLMHRLDLEGRYLDSRWASVPHPEGGQFLPYHTALKALGDELLLFASVTGQAERSAKSRWSILGLSFR
ncbi:MAG TPA: hypothetical protein VNG33_15765 [Polyangiaceae bacterium]|nr:hypothetical protein [Polyangiaceae bacterium]